MSLRTCIRKVKSHIGIKGNEAADALAGSATNSAECDTQFGLGNEGLTGTYWPVIKIEAASNNAEHTTRLWAAGNLNSSIKSSIKPHSQIGNANLTQYVQLWKGIEASTVPNIHEASWNTPAVTLPMLRNTLKARYGQLWNKHMAFIRNMPYRNGLGVARNDSCPLCGQPDSGSHILGGCGHPEMKKAYISRHNAAGRLILKAIQSGAKGNCFTIADIGSHDKLEGIETQGTRLPAWLISEDTIKTVSRKPVTDAAHTEYPAQQDKANVNEPSSATRDIDISKLRPDILMLDMTSDEINAKLRKRRHDSTAVFANQCAPGSRKLKVTVIEIGYVSDTRYHDKMKEKQDQHKMLCSLLKEEGYEVEFLPIVLGNSRQHFHVCRKSNDSLGY